MRNAFRPKEKIPEQPHVPPMPKIAQSQYKECKYLLPCGICDKTNEICSQYAYEVTKIYIEEVEEDFGSWKVIKKE